MKKLFKTFAAVALIGSISFLSSCDKVCDEGYEGDDCKTQIRAKFLGAWQGPETCTVGTDNYTLTIASSSTDVLKITLTNIYGSAFVASATVSGSNFTVANQNVGASVTVQGSGSVNGNALTFTYTIADGSTSNTCTFNGTKL